MFLRINYFSELLLHSKVPEESVLIMLLSNLAHLFSRKFICDLGTILTISYYVSQNSSSFASKKHALHSRKSSCNQESACISYLIATKSLESKLSSYVFFVLMQYFARTSSLRTRFIFMHDSQQIVILMLGE